MPVATLADIQGIEARGADEAWPGNTYDMIRRGAGIAPDAPAITFFVSADRFADARRWSYAQLLARITQAANAFSTLGVEKDDVVAVVLPNLPESHFALWGAEAAGIAAVFNPMLEPATLASLIASVGAKLLVTGAPIPKFDLLERLTPELTRCPSLRHIVTVDITGYLPDATQAALRPHLQASAGRLDEAMAPLEVRRHDFAELVIAQPGTGLASGRTIASADRASMFCTGGTTGLPKIAIRSHGCEVANVRAIGQTFGGAIDRSSTFFCGLPLFHVNGVIVTGAFPFSIGAHVVIGTPEGYRGDGVIARFWEIVAHYRVNFFSAVPTLYSALMHTPVKGHDIASLRFGLCGAAPMPVEVFRAFERTTGLNILEGYGLTEACCVSSVNPPAGDRRVGSIGMRLPGQDMKAVVLDAGGGYVRDCEADEVGALIVAGPNVFDGYLSPDHNAGLWIDCGDGKRWLNTGDLGRQDVDGYFWLTGRKKELIIRGGHNIDPAMIEEPLHEHPEVQMVAVIGRPDAYAGELPVAYVQLKPLSKATADDLAAFARAKIGERAALPKFIRVVSQIPVTSVGKIFKPALKRMETEYAISAALCEAGQSKCQVTAVETVERGLVLKVTLLAGADELAVRHVLGTFSYPFYIEHAS